MISQEKQNELEKYKAIVIACLHYLEQKSGKSFVVDGESITATYYQQQQIQAEKYFQQRRLDRLKQQFTRLQSSLRHVADNNFSEYIKNTTGYEVDIFEQLKNKAKVLLEQKEIRDKKDFDKIGELLYYFEKTAPDPYTVEQLHELMSNYSQNNPQLFEKKDREHTEEISRVVKDGVEIVTFQIKTGPKPKHFNEEMLSSPDGKKWLRVEQWSDGKHASTTVSIGFPGNNGPIYSVSEICADIKAYWKDDHTILIETKKGIRTSCQHRLVQSFEDHVQVEYIEK